MRGSGMVSPVCRLCSCNICSDLSHWSSCIARTGELNVADERRSGELNEALLNAVSADVLWFQYGMVANVRVRLHVPTRSSAHCSCWSSLSLQNSPGQTYTSSLPPTYFTRSSKAPSRITWCHGSKHISRRFTERP